jgi:GNAT superfamily N-acetyltransferase
MPEPAKAEVSLRALGAGDIAFANQVRSLAGWNQTEHDWRGYLAYEPAGCFIAEVGGQPAGTATTIRYGDRFGWIGMVLVHPDQRRHGVGTQLLRHCIAYLQRAGVSSIKLDATPMGKKVYVPMGFVDEYEISRYEGVMPPAAGAADNVSAFTSADVEAVAKFDAPVFGADRAKVIASLRGRNPDWCFVARKGGDISGYLIARQGASAVQIGPWIACDSVTAENLWRAVSARIAGKRTFVDVPAPNSAGVALMQRNGFTVQRTLTRMFFGQNTHPGTPGQIYSTGGPEKG